MSFPQVRENLQAAIFVRLGEDAFYNGGVQPVRVRVAEGDETANFGEGGRLILGAKTVKVRRSEVLSPREADLFVLAKGGRTFRVLGEPMLDRNAVWMCPATEVI